MRKYLPLCVYTLAALLVIGLAQGKQINAYIQMIIMYIGINIMLSSSLNIVNGYMGEFACGHAAFMAVGAYVTSVLNVWLFTNSQVFGKAVLPSATVLFFFPVTLLIGGFGAALTALLIAVPSFKTRDDYLAIITLAVNFIVKSSIENIQAIGGARGFMGMSKVIAAMDKVTKLPWMLIWILIATGVVIWVIYRFVNSTYGKGMLAIRDDEISAEIMGINTRHIKIVAFMLSAGIAGIAGGLFAHVGGGYINPGIFTIMKSTECLVMVYLGGMGSLSGSILSAIVFTVILELHRFLSVPLGDLMQHVPHTGWWNLLVAPLNKVLIPLLLNKWVVIPVLLIVLMRFRPEGIMGQRELIDIFPKFRQWFAPKEEHA
jgi:branched-chain amino acid transport system permease protein